MPCPAYRHARWLVLALTFTIASSLVATSAFARLSNDVVPTFQSIRLHLDADSSRYTGSVHIELDVRQPTTTVALYADGETLEKVTLTQNKKSIAVTQTTGDHGLLTLTAPAPLAKGPAVLEIRFNQAFNTQAASLYRMDKDGRGYAFTQFEAEDARGAFPCFDEPSFKFPYQLTLEVPERHQALFNTPVERESTKDGWKTIVYKKTPPLPSYLLAIATGPLEFTPVAGMKVPTRIVTVKGQSGLTGKAAEMTPPILAALEKYFGRPYPFEKLDLIAVPEYWAGAMENPGAITYSDNILLVDPKAMTDAQKQTLVRVTAHELAHMWFGDLVTMAWWDDLWLNESFADWMGDKITNQVVPEYKTPLAELQSIQDIMRTDARPSTDAIRLHAENGDQAMRQVGIAYNKGKSVLAMFELWMGAETFRKGVNDYIAAHEWKNAVAADLWSALGKASGKDVATLMGHYIEQPGHPIVTVEALEGGRLQLSQKRFLNFGVQAPALTWEIPMTIEYSDGATTRSVSVVLGAEPQSVKLETDKVAWVMPNGGAHGYYRWTVPQEMLLALARQAQTAMDPAERIAFLGNVTALLDAGTIHGDSYLRVIAGMAGDPEPRVASSVLRSLDQARGAFVPDSLQEPFAGYVRRTLKPMVDRFGLERRANEDPAVTLLRPQLLGQLGRDGRDEAAIAVARSVAAKFMSDPQSVDPSLVGASLQLNALTGDRALFARYRTALESSKVPAIRDRYIQALGHFADPALEDSALRYCLEGPLRPNEFMAVARGVGMRSDRGSEKSFAWMRQNYEKIASRFPPMFRPFMAYWGSGCSAERYAAAKEFFSDPSRTVPGMDTQLAKVADQVHDCVGLREREGATVAAFLRAEVASAHD